MKVRAAGTSTTVIDANAPLTADKAYTIIATGRVASIAPLVLEDNLTNPAAGNIKLNYPANVDGENHRQTLAEEFSGWTFD